MPLHVASLVVLDAKANVGYDEVRDHIESRLHLLEPFRWRLAPVPLGIDHPYWITDPDFDLDFHLRRARVPPPGNDEQLAELVAQIHARPLDRNHPLWEMYVIDGRSDGSVAVLTKMHHAAIDGIAGGEILATLLDADPAATPRRGRRVVAEDEPTTPQMLARGMRGLVRRPRQAVEAIRHSAGSRPYLGHVARMVLPEAVRQRRADLMATPHAQAPATPFNHFVSADRTVATGSLPLAVVKQIKDAHEVTVNDVVMAICAGGLRRYLAARSALPDEPLQALVPVSVRSEDEAGTMGNRVTAMVALVPTHLDDPVARLAESAADMNTAKAHDLLPAELLADYSQVAMPTLVSGAARLLARLHWAERLRFPVNLVISNIPGPQRCLYLAGAPVRHVYPLSTIADGCALNITVHSYDGKVEIGIVACASAVPSAGALLDDLRAEYRELVELSG